MYFKTKIHLNYAQNTKYLYVGFWKIQFKDFIERKNIFIALMNLEIINGLKAILLLNFEQPKMKIENIKYMGK